MQELSRRSPLNGPLAARLVLWAVLAGAGSVWLARNELSNQREAFETDARIAHRLLSQQVVQHDAILATLALLQPAVDVTTSARPEQRLSALYPQIIGVLRRERDLSWPDDALTRAEAASRATRRPALVDLDFAAEHYRIVLGADPTSYALVLQARNMVPWAEWPMARATSPVRVSLEQSGQRLVLQPGRAGERGWRFEFHKHLASESQPFDVAAVRQVGWSELPWLWMVLWSVLVALALTAQQALERQRAARRRAEELLRLGQVARLNTLGELAAGMAHELNQPLTAVLANTQAAKRLLADDPPELDTARTAMAQAVEQARRASDVVARLRRAVERPDGQAPAQPVDLQTTVRNALYLLEPECTRRSVTPQVVMALRAGAVVVQADPVALEQIVHNLLMNALQALEQVPAAERRLTLQLDEAGERGVLRVMDTGPGIAPEALPRLFEPFFSTRSGGLGLGLSLCETLASGMGGSLAAAANTPRGAVFTLTLPLAPDGAAP